MNGTITCVNLAILLTPPKTIIPIIKTKKYPKFVLGIPQAFSAEIAMLLACIHGKQKPTAIIVLRAKITAYVLFFIALSI